ncbi:MAG: sulfurtransferase [Acidiferrobacteraceae bacterium]
MVFDTLVDAETLKHHLPRTDWAVVDCRFRLDDATWGVGAYGKGHLPGARYAALEHDLAAPAATGLGRHPLPMQRRLCEWLGAQGITAQTQVVAYDDAGGIYAARLWWLLRLLGHRKAAILDGGLSAWSAADGAMTEQVIPAAPCVYEPSVPHAWAVDTDRVEQGLARLGRDWILVDARSPARFQGREEPLDAVAGHIPGAVNLPFAENLDSDGRFLPGTVLRDRFRRALGSAVADARVVHMCGSGVSACHNLLAMEHAGLSGSGLYVGSWSAWSADPKRPVGTGA